MVKSRFAPIAASLILGQLLFSACGLKSFWNKEKITVGIAQSELSSSACPAFESVFSNPSDSDSETALNCYLSKVENIWGQVQGEQKDTLTEDELKTLVRKGIVSIPGDTEVTLNRIFTAKRLIGFPGAVTKQKMDEWISWARKNRPLARTLYRKFHLHEGHVYYSDIDGLVRLFASAMKKMNWSMDSHDLSHAITTILDVQDRDIRAAIAPGAEVAINFLNTVCPNFRDKDVWETDSLASCFVGMVEEFKVGAPWFEFLVNPVDDLTMGQLADVQRTIDPNPSYANDPTRLTYHVNKWFRQPNLGILYPSRWTDLARRMGANPPNDLLDSLRVIRRFGSRSSEEAIYPEAAIWVFELAQKTQTAILNGMPYFLGAVRHHSCANANALYWTDCVLSDYQRASLLSPEIDTATRVKNLHHGVNSAPMSGREFSKIMFFHNASEQIISVFHDDDQKCASDSIAASAANDTNPGPSPKCDTSLITTDLGDANDKLVQLITVGVTSAQTIERFYGNIERKIKHLPIANNDGSFLNRRRDVGGFARLIAMTSDILVKRTQKETNILAGILANIIPPTASSLSLDRLAVTAILTTIDALPQYRNSYLQITDDAPAPDAERTNKWNIRYIKDPITSDYLVNRASVIKNLKSLMQENFPRTYASCVEFGFEKSCELAIDKILSAPSPGSEYIHAGDLDIITIIAMGVEGILDNCDQPDSNGQTDGYLSWDIFDGQDELDCGFNRTQDIVKRLIESKILDMSDGDRKKTELLLGVMNATFITRIAGKVAMVRGTTQNMVLDIPLFWLYNKASIGSMYGLVADIADPVRARSIK